MHRFFAQTIPPAGETGRLDPDESRHAYRVLRVREGELIDVLDGCGVRAKGQITGLPGAPRRAIVEYWVAHREALPEPALRVRLFVAPPRPKAMALIVQQATELGVLRITPVQCEFGVSRPVKRSSMDHWRNEAISALKQSGNPHVPTLDRLLDFGEAVEHCRGLVGAFGERPDQCYGRPSLPREGDVALWIGPEGGFSAEEREKLAAARMVPVSVGEHVLRVETAVAAVTGWLMGRARGSTASPPSERRPTAVGGSEEPSPPHSQLRPEPENPEQAAP